VFVGEHDHVEMLLIMIMTGGHLLGIISSLTSWPSAEPLHGVEWCLIAGRCRPAVVSVARLVGVFFWQSRLHAWHTPATGAASTEGKQ
jgi:hypothetical protein